VELARARLDISPTNLDLVYQTNAAAILLASHPMPTSSAQAAAAFALQGIIRTKLVYAYQTPPAARTLPVNPVAMSTKNVR